MADRKLYQDIHDGTVASNFGIGVTRKHLTVELEKHIQLRQGKLPHYGFSFETFGSFVGDKYRLWPDTDVRVQAMSACHMAMCHFMWSFSKACFSPEQELKEHIIKSEPPRVLPCALLRKLPHWSQWIDCNFAVDVTENGVIEKTLHLSGFWATYCKVEQRLNLCLSALGVYYPNGDSSKGVEMARVSCMFEIEQDKPLDDTFLFDVFLVGQNGSYGIREDNPEYDSFRSMVKRWAEQSVNILLFITGEVDELYRGGVKHISPRLKGKGKNYRLSPVAKERQWTVGQKFLEPIREYENAIRTMTAPQKRAAHIRRGHYHSFWRGPRHGERELFSKWLPPCVVSGTLAD